MIPSKTLFSSVDLGSKKEVGRTETGDPKNHYTQINILVLSVYWQ